MWAPSSFFVLVPYSLCVPAELFKGYLAFLSLLKFDMLLSVIVLMMLNFTVLTKSAVVIIGLVMVLFSIFWWVQPQTLSSCLMYYTKVVYACGLQGLDGLVCGTLFVGLCFQVFL